MKKKNQPDKTNKSFTGEISDVRMDKDSGTTWVKVRLDDGTILGGKFLAVDDGVVETDLSQIDYKITKLSPDAVAALNTGLDSISLIGGPTNRFVSTDQNGNFVVGPVSFTAHPDSIKIGGIFRLNGLMASMMPSTIITPIPTLILDIPGANLITSLTSILGEFSSLLGL